MSHRPKSSPAKTGTGAPSAPISASDRTDDWTEEKEQAARLASSRTEDANDLHASETTADNNHSQSLRSKLVLALALMLAVAVALDEFVRQYVIAPEFENLEWLAAVKDTNRVMLAINTDIENLADLAGIGARHHKLSKQDQSDSQPASLANLSDIMGLHSHDHAAVVNPQGQWKWLTEHDSASENEEHDLLKTSLCGLPESVLLDDHGITTGCDGKLYLFAFSLDTAHDSADANDEDMVIIVRPMNDEMIKNIERRTSVSFSITPIKESESPNHVQEFQDNHVVRSPLVDPSGNPLARLEVQIPRDFTTRSAHTTAIARYLSICGACASLLLLLLLLQRIVIGRIETIREHTERIAQSGILTEDSDNPKLQVAGTDEIGQLADSFERMRSRLGNAQRRLADASHAAGMSVVADTVIHNVGNVLTNVNSLIDSASQRVDDLRIEPLERLADRLRTNEIDNDLQQAMPDYLAMLSQTLEDDRDDLSELLRTLMENVQHIHQVIRDQSRHAKHTVEWSDVSIHQIVGEAIRCCQARLDKDNVQVHFHTDSDSLVRSDRSLLLQVLINILGNARNAMREIEGKQSELQIDLIKTVSTIHLRFRDNGCGMDEVTLGRIFDAHFTTHQSGTGLGLHFCALAMKRLGGTIYAESDGPEQGTTFILEIPVKPELVSESRTPELNSAGQK